MHSLLQLLLVFVFAYWTATLPHPLDRARRESARVPGRLASEPPGEPLDNDDDEDTAAMQPSIERVFRSPSPTRRSNQAHDRNEPILRSSVRAAPCGVTSTPQRSVGLSTPPTSNRTRRASGASTAPAASSHSVRWARPLESSSGPALRSVSGDEGANPVPLPRGVRASMSVTPLSCEMTSMGSSLGTSSSLAFRSSNAQASSSPSRPRVVPSTSRSAAPTPSISRAGRMTPGPSTNRSSSLAPTTPASSASRSGRMTTRGMAFEGGTNAPSGRASPSAVSTTSMASSVSTWSANKRILDVYDRQFVWFKNHADTMLENGEPAGTGWFESESDSDIYQPPDFSVCKDVRVGDIFCHRTPTVCQLWIWAQPTDNRLPSWEAVQLGFRRWDGRKLIVTKSRRRPSWVL